MKQLALWSLIAGALQGCAISTPFPRLDPEGPPVVMVITHGTLDTRRRAEFDRQTALVTASLAGQPGIQGYSVRRELFGPEVWTLTLWRDEAAMAAFRASAPHRQAVDAASSALVDMRSLRTRVERAQVPASWRDALELLDQGGARRLWE